jgi:hypothetical protein
MREAKIIEQLNSLKSIQPDSDWKNRCRDILYAQISAGRVEAETKEMKQSFWVSCKQSFMPQHMLLDLARPIWVMAIVFTVVASGSFASVYASRGAKPGDSLYIAKIISEKAQLAMTFDETEKTKLGIEFAGNRANEIKQVLNESAGENGGTEQKVEKLADNFRKEISHVKSRLEKISAAGISEPVIGTVEEDAPMFSADMGKTDAGMQISGSSQPSAATVDETAAEANVATSTAEKESIAEESVSPDKIIEEAEKLFAEEDYDGVINKLIEANTAIEQKASVDGTVKGVEESSVENATSTDLLE